MGQLSNEPKTGVGRVDFGVKVGVEAYRFGFNGKERDNSFGGSSVYDYGFRIYNPQIAKFLSVDPLTKSYPMLTPYQFASNTPIQAIDLDGLEAKIVVNSQYNSRRVAMLFNGGKTNVERNLNRQKALVIGWYSVDRQYKNDAHTRMYPDVDFPTHGKAATLERNNSFEGVQIWGTSESGKEYYIGGIDQQSEQSWFSSVLDGLENLTSDKERGADALEKIIAKNIDQGQINELMDAFGGELDKIKFLKDKGVLPDRTLTGLPSYEGPFQEFEEVPGDSGVFRSFDNDGNYVPRIGPRLSPGGGISPKSSRPVRDKKDSTKHNIK